MTRRVREVAVPLLSLLANVDRVQQVWARVVDAARDDTLLQTIADWLASTPTGAVRGKASDLLAQLRAYADRNDMLGASRRESQAPWFPKNPRALAAQLKNHRRLLQVIGVNWSTEADPMSSTSGAFHSLSLERHHAPAPQEEREDNPSAEGELEDADF